MKNYCLLFELIFFPASAFARYWIVKRPDCRPINLSNETLQLIGGAGLICLLAGCFMVFNLGDRSLRPVVTLVIALAYDLALRWFFFKKEVHRVCKNSKCGRETAIVRVKRRAGYGVATLHRFQGWRSSRRRKIDPPQPGAEIEQAW